MGAGASKANKPKLGKKMGREAVDTHDKDAVSISQKLESPPSEANSPEPHSRLSPPVKEANQAGKTNGGLQNLFGSVFKGTKKNNSKMDSKKMFRISQVYVSFTFKSRIYEHFHLKDS